MSCRWLTINEVAEVLMVHRTTVQRMIKRGELSAVHMGHTVRICATVPKTGQTLASPDRIYRRNVN